jgi:hypothetical protein
MDLRTLFSDYKEKILSVAEIRVITTKEERRKDR